MRQILFVLLACTVAFACRGNVPEKQASPPKADLSTPDNAVKSFWKSQIWQDTTFLPDTNLFGFFTEEGKEAYRESIGERRIGLMGHNAKNNNKIEKVSVESDSRAVVLTEEFIQLESIIVGEKDTKFILNKKGREWKIEDRLRECKACEGKGSVLDDDTLLKDIKAGLYGTRPMMKCSACDGTGWKSMYAEETIYEPQY
ncbi:MAG TPA: hypothetical protein VKS81_10955 [Bacteroidota bacterium]|nr:hypothetical protein [Bacteroidota bacterium]